MTNRVALAFAGAAPLLLSLLSGCIPSNVVAQEERAVVVAADRIVWDTAVPTSLTGLWESRQITGSVAQTLWKAYYHFCADGSFSGAALVLSDGMPRFSTLAGTYAIDGGQIRLGEDAEPARIEAGGGHLRLTSAEGCLVLRQVDV